MSSTEYDLNSSEQRFHYILIDRNGPLAEFETWEDAFQCMSTHQVEGGSIVRCDGPMAERPGPNAGSNDSRASGVGGAANARSQPARSTAEQALPKPTRKVLVISEDISTLLSMTQVVKGAGHGVTIGRSAAEAVQTIGL